MPFVMRAGTHEYESTWRPVTCTCRMPLRPDASSSFQ